VSLLEQLRANGLRMGGSYPPQAVETRDEEGELVTLTHRRWYGWTTDKAKADAARDAGATVTAVSSPDPRCSGWEVAVTEVVRGF